MALAMASTGAATVRLPLTFKKLVCTRLTHVFREAVELQTAQILPGDIKPGEIVVRNRYVGINASEINFTAGKLIMLAYCMDLPLAQICH